LSENVQGNRQPINAKIGELTPNSRAVNVIAKAVSKSEVRDIASGRDGAPHRVCDALIGDETGVVYLTLWDDNIEKVKIDETISIGNGYVNLFKGNMRLNVGRLGTLEPAKEPLAGEVKTDNNMSDKVYEQEYRPYRGGGRGGYGGGGYGGGGRGYGSGGYRQRRY
jgi:ssDNA-binding replication factor A large subunit